MQGIDTKGDAADYIRRQKLRALRDEFSRRIEGEGRDSYDVEEDRKADEEVEANP